MLIVIQNIVPEKQPETIHRTHVLFHCTSWFLLFCHLGE